MRLYLATPVDRNAKALKEGTDLATRLAAAWPEMEKVVMFSPVGAFSTIYQGLSEQNEYSWIVEINEMAAFTSDAMIVWYRRGVESWGVPQEVLLSAQWHKAIFVLSEDQDHGELPLYLKSRVAPDHVFRTIETLVTKLLEENPHATSKHD